MLKHYIKFAIRNFRSNKTIFAGSLATLCLGALCISLLFSYVYNELTMDDFHEKKDNIYIIETKSSPVSNWIQGTGHFRAEDYSGIDNKFLLKRYGKGELKFKNNETVLTPEGIVADSSFINAFDFKLKSGDRNSALDDINSVLLTEDLAQSLFGSEDVIDKTITISWRYEEAFTVKGVLENPPPNSSIDFDFIIKDDEYNGNKFSRMPVEFMVVNENFNKETFLKKINEEYYYPKNRELNIVPLSENYYNPNISSVKHSVFSRWGNEKNLKILIAIIIVIFVITILNFSNLQIIASNHTIKNISINKIHGAGKTSLVAQKSVEALLLIFLATLIVTFFYNLLLPSFNALVNLNLSPPTTQIFLINFSIILMASLVGFLYPTILMLKLSIVDSINGAMFLGQNFLGRKLILVLQYILTLVLIISTITVHRQLDLLLNKDLGFKKENIIISKLFHPIPAFSMSDEERVKMHEEQINSFQYLKNELSNHTSIVSFSRGTSPLDVYKMGWKSSADMEYTTHNTLIITPNYKNILGLTMVEGRFFEENIDRERSQKAVINEAAKKLWNINDITQQKMFNQSWGGEKDGFEIIGVVKDFNYEHLSAKPQPLMILYFDDIEDDFLIQFRDGQVQEGLAFVESLFNKVNPNETFEFSFLSDDIATLYDKEKRLSTIYILFTIITLLISAIGLFTIALYDTQRRIKEIGVRKVNGATVPEILLMLNKDFMKWVLLAFIIACPIAYYAMHKWLENFAYKTNLSWWVFVLAGVFTLIIALLTVSWQSYKAATQNPTESLRDE